MPVLIIGILLVAAALLGLLFVPVLVVIVSGIVLVVGAFFVNGEDDPDEV